MTTDPNAQMKCCIKEKHFWKEKRGMRQKSPGPPFRYSWTCTFCQAILYKIVGEKVDHNGTISPWSQVYMEISGSTYKIDTRIWRLVAKNIPSEKEGGNNGEG